MTMFSGVSENEHTAVTMDIAAGIVNPRGSLFPFNRFLTESAALLVRVNPRDSVRLATKASKRKKKNQSSWYLLEIVVDGLWTSAIVTNLQYVL